MRALRERAVGALQPGRECRMQNAASSGIGCTQHVEIYPSRSKGELQSDG